MGKDDTRFNYNCFFSSDLRYIWCNQVTSSGVSSIFYFSRNLSHFFLKYPNGLFNLHPLENQPNIYLELLKYPKGLFNRHPLVNQSMAT